MISNKKFRIAVCFSGQARTWKICSENIKKFFTYNRIYEPDMCQITTDFFIHTWDTNTWRFPKREHQYFYNETHSDTDDIENEFNPIKMEVQKLNKKQFLNNNPWLPMFYSFEKSLLMKRDYELDNGFTYDVVIKARLDTIYNPQQQIPFWRIPIGSLELMPGMCYSVTPISKFTYEFNYNVFDDVLFYGDSRTMDLVGDLYRSFQHRYTKDEFNDIGNGVNVEPSLHYGPGTLLYDHMIRMGIHPTQITEPIGFLVVRKESEGLNSISDFDKIKKISKDYYINFLEPNTRI